ncbi:MAG: biopolymer transporter ExbD [Desulfuromonas sp.]|nr:MAG: biopolymer transporter ExbD [Desulfuromonas sp.]
MAFRRKRREEVRPDLTPMIDVVFLLLIFFMISTTFVETSGMSIKLPDADARPIDREPKELRVQVNRQGEIFIKDKLFTLDEFANTLDTYSGRAAGMTFILLADESAKHGRVVTLMDMARARGFVKLAIATDPRK